MATSREVLTMSFVLTDTSVVFTDPGSVAFLAVGSNPDTVDAVTAPVQIGGGDPDTDTPGRTYTTTDAPDGEIAQVFLSGYQTRLNVGSGAANITAAGGGQIVEAADADNTGSRIIKLGVDSILYNGGIVDESATVAGDSSGESVTIAEAAGGQGGSFAYYAHAGAGDDQIEGSSQADFIRGGAGNDTINGFDGNDLIRGGSGSDQIESGRGSDTLYYTADQLDGSVDTFVDFTAAEDKISFDSTAVSSLDQISGLGTNTIIITGGAGNNTVITSQNDAITGDDINFV